MVGRKVRRQDVEAYYLPATNLANDHEISTLANMIMTGKVMQEVAALGAGNVDAALHKVVSARHQDLLELNKKALLLGAQA